MQDTQEASRPDLTDPIIIRPSKSKRMHLSDAARRRRRSTKIVKNLHTFKEESDARQRLRAKRKLERQKRRVRNLRNLTKR